MAWLILGAAAARAQSTYQFAIPTYAVYENGTNVTVAVIRTGDTSVPGMVSFSTTDGTPPNGATAPNDYTSTNGVLTFAPGEIVQTFNVFITDEVGAAPPENDEFLNLTLSNPMGGVLGLLSTAQIVIWDDDTCFVFATMLPNRQGLPEVDEDVTNAVIRIIRNPPSSGPASVVLQTFNGPMGGAVAPGDYLPLNTNIVFAPNQSSVDVLLPIIDDCLVETNNVRSNRLESILLILTNAVGARVGAPSCPNNVATLDILDNDTPAGQFQFSVMGPSSVMEGGGINVAVSRLCNTAGAVTVDFDMFNDVRGEPGNLCNGQPDAYWSGQRNDYTFANSRIMQTGLPGSTLNWADGEGGTKVITITTLNDARVELDESILIRLFNATGGATIGPRRQFEVIILNNDRPAGSADTSYNTLTVLNPTPGANSTVYAAVTYGDGSERSIIGGDFSAVNAVVRGGVARINANGSTDLTFDPGSGADGFVSVLALQPDGKVLVGGGFTSMDNLSSRGLARLNDDGTLDTTFDVGAGVEGSVHAIAVQPDGKVIIAGEFSAYNNVPRERVARLNADGSLDFDFDPGSGPDDTVYALALQADGAVLLGGAFMLVNGEFLNRVARLGTNGAVDPSWQPIAGADNTVFALRLDPNGLALIGGAFRNYDGEMAQGLARLQTNGLLDRTYGACRGMDGVIYSIALQPDGRAVAGGDFTVYNDTPRTNIVRLLPDGVVDTSFLDNFYNRAAPGADSFVAAVSLQQDGNVILGGGFSLLGGGWNTANGYSPPDHTEIRFNYGRLLGGITDPVFLPPYQWFTENSPGNLQLVQAAYSIDEHVLGGFLAVTAERVNGGLGSAQVGYRTVDGSARAGVDYTAVNGTVFWGDCSDGQRLIFIPILDNSAVDGNKNFFIEFFEPEAGGGASFPQPALGFNCRAEITIVDNDEARGVIGFARPIFTVLENQTNALITVTRTNGSEGQVTVQYQTANGSAVAGTGQDYTARTGTLTFGSGETNKIIQVPINNDIFSEFEENFSIRLFNLQDIAGGARLGLTNATVLIFDNETGPGSISFTAAEFAVSEAQTNIAITLRRTGGTAGSVSVEFRTTDLPPGPGAARANVDYGALTNTVTFAGSVTSQVVNIPILADRLVEGAEQVALSIQNVSGGASIGFINGATLTIQDDDAYGSLSFSATNYYVPEEGGVAVIDVVRTGGDAEEVTVDFLVVQGTATDGVDFLSTNGTLTFPDGVVVQTISVPIYDDSDLEGAENILLSLFNFSKASIGPFPDAALTINDDEAQAVAAGSIDTSFNPIPGPNDFVSAIAIQPDGQIVAAGDFTAFGGVMRRRVARLNIDGSIDATFNPGLGADATVNAVALQPDGKMILGGAFTRIGNRNRAHVARLTSAGVLDTSFNPGAGADNPVYALALQPDGRVILGGDFATFNGISRNGIVRLLPNGVNDQTFQPGTGANGTVFAVALLPDGRILIGGEFTTCDNLSAPYLARLHADGSLDTGFNIGAEIDGPVRTIAVQPDGKIVIGGSFTVVGNEYRPYLARLEADGTLDAGFQTGSGPDNIVYSAALQSDGRVVIGGEFTSVNGLVQNRIARVRANGALDTTINFGTGANLFVAAVTLQTDASIVIGGGFTEVSGAPRPYIARLVGGEDVSPGTIQFVQAGYSVLESGTNIVITVARVLGSEGPVEVDVVSGDLGSAVGGVDYGVINERLTFTDGEVIKTIVVGITNDLAVEPNETFQLSLTNVAGGAVLNEAAVTYVTIVNEDSALAFTFPVFNVNEKVIGTNAVIGVVRIGATNDPVTVDFATATIPGGATDGVDFEGVAGTLTFLPGQTNLNFFVPILDDLLVEGNEAFEVALFNNTGSSVLDLSQAAVNIIDNDFSPGGLSFEFTAYSVNESNPSVTLTLVRTNGTTGVVSVDWGVGAATALNGVDFLAPGGVISLADGETNKSITIQILDDLTVEGNESFEVTISNPTGGSFISGPAAVTVTIEDNEFGPGSLDPAFDIGTGANNPVKSVAVAADGRVIAGGEFTNFNGMARGYIVRLNVDGSVDTAFASSVGANGLINAVGVYADGRVAAGGSFTTVNGQSFGRVVRFGTNGLPDPSFTQGAGVNGTVQALLTGSGVRATVGGAFSLPTRYVARFLAEGAQDATFNPSQGPDAVVHALAAHPAGGFVIGGSFSTYNGLTRQRVARLFPSGLPDQTWVPAGVAGGNVYAVVVQPDGRTLIGGSFTDVGGQPRARLARLNTNGTLDVTFNPGAGANGDVRAILLQPDGRILIGGSFTNYDGTPRVRVARLESGGALDTTFDPGRGANNTVYSMALEPDGKVVMGGAFTMVNGYVRHGVARLNGDQPPVQFAAAAMGQGGPLLTLRTTPGGVYVIEASRDFQSWTPIRTNAASGYELLFTDPGAHGLDRRFYRARQVPR